MISWKDIAKRFRDMYRTELAGGKKLRDIWLEEVKRRVNAETSLTVFKERSKEAIELLKREREIEMNLEAFFRSPEGKKTWWAPREWHDKATKLRMDIREWLKEMGA